MKGYTPVFLLLCDANAFFYFKVFFLHFRFSPSACFLVKKFFKQNKQKFSDLKIKKFNKKNFYYFILNKIKLLFCTYLVYYNDVYIIAFTNVFSAYKKRVKIKN